MSFSHVLALGIFTSYFLLIVLLFYVILSTLPRSVNPYSLTRATATFSTLAVVSFANTWFYMFQFLIWSFHNYEKSTSHKLEGGLARITKWLVNSSLFEQAWAAVCFRPLNWWWSEQLCIFTVGAWTVFLAVEGHQSRVKHIWAYMLLGQVVAISVASNLFYLALSLSQPTSRPREQLATPRLWISIFLSLLTIGITPFTSERTFLPNLLAMHTLLVLPLIPSPTHSTGGRFNIRTRTLYTFSAVFALVLRLRTTSAVISSFSGAATPMLFFNSIWEILHSHPAQSSIGWDVVWTSISFVVWALLESPPSQSLSKLLLLIPTTLLGSVGVSAPYLLRSRHQDDVKKTV